MAKRGRKPRVKDGTEFPGGQPTGPELPGGHPAGVESGGAVEGAVGQFAEDLGQLIGQTQSRAEAWLGQRKAILRNLVGLRDTVNDLIQRIGDGYGAARSGAARKPGRPGKTDPGDKVGNGRKPKRKPLSAEARAKISAAQKARWAKQQGRK